MATTINHFISDGMNQEFDIQFEYLSRGYVFVTVEDQPTPFTWLTAERIRLDAPVEQGKVIILFRRTDTSKRLVNFTDGSILRGRDLDISALQSIHIAEEARDYTKSGAVMGQDVNNNHWNAELRKIQNTHDPEEPYDVANKRYVDTEGTNAMQHAKTSAAEAAMSAATAKSSEDRVVRASETAMSAESSALASAMSAKSSETRAEACATEAVNAASQAGAARNEVVPHADTVKQAALFAAEATRLAQTTVNDVQALGAVPIGMVVSFLSRPLPAGYLELDGSTFDPAVYPALFTALKTTSLPVLPGDTAIHAIKAAGVVAPEGLHVAEGVQKRVVNIDSQHGLTKALVDASMGYAPDNLTTPGRYYTGDGLLVVTTLKDGSTAQEYIRTAAPSAISIRYQSGNEWSAWGKMVSEAAVDGHWDARLNQRMTFTF